MMSCRADMKQFEIKEQYVDTNRSERLTFEREHSNWGNRSCNCGHSLCRLFCAAVLWLFREIRSTTPMFQRVDPSHKLVVGGNQQPRIAFVHCLKWDASARRPVVVTVFQPWSRVKDLISLSLATRKSSLPPFLAPFCRHRGDITVSVMQKEMQAMGKHVREQQLEVNVLLYRWYLYVLCLMIMWETAHVKETVQNKLSLS